MQVFRKTMTIILLLIMIMLESKYKNLIRLKCLLNIFIQMTNEIRTLNIFSENPPSPLLHLPVLLLRQLYTVVQHVKHFNDVVEFGENQEFTDDFEYLETGLKSSQPLNTRCLR